MPKSEGLRRAILAAIGLALAGLAACGPKPAGTYAHTGGVVDGWLRWGHGNMGQRYSANTQITPDNVKDLQVAWTYRTGDLSAARPSMPTWRSRRRPSWPTTRCICASPRNRIIALDPTTGKQKWMFDAASRHQRRHRHHLPRRVLLEGQRKRRGRLLAAHLRRHHRRQDVGAGCRHRQAVRRLSASTASVDLHDNLGFIEKPGLYGVSSAPTIVGDMVITGSKIIDFHNTDMPGGVVRALNARTGEVVWAFDRRAAGPCRPGRRQDLIRAAPPMCGRPCRWMRSAT